MGRARVRGRLVAACAVLAATIAVIPAGAAPCADHVALPDQWTMIPSPAFGEGNAAMTTYDVGDVSTRNLVVTNGRVIVSTRDGGCTWTTADLTADRPLPGPDLPLGEGARVVGRTISQVRFASGFTPFVWAIGQTDVAAEGLATSQPRVLLSTDFGTTFAPVTAGLPPFGRPVAIRGAGQTALLLIRRTAPVADYALYRYDGTAWSELWTGLSAMEDFVVDSVSPPSRENPAVWLWNSTGAYTGRLSDDAPRLVRDVNGNVRTVDLLLSGNAPAQVSVYYRSAAERAVSRDGGVRFVREPAPLDVQSVSSYQLIPGVRAISSLETNVLIEAPTRPTGVDFSPRDYNVSDVQFVSTPARAGLPLYAFHATALFLRYVPVTFQPPALPIPEPEDPVDVDVRPPSLTVDRAAIEPRKEVVRLRPGQRKVVDYQVQLPPVPTPLDVFFMTDSTGSMDDTITSVQYGVQDIVDGLAATGISVFFGVADFRDYKNGPSDRSNYPYKRRRAIGPIDTVLAEALESITTGGGNNTGGHDAGLEAIYQAATGAGRPDPVMVGQYLVEPGFGAEFRPNAMKVILVATDDNFRHASNPASPTYPVPPIETVSQVLQAKGIYLVGLEVDTNSGSARPDMERLARDTGAVAPEGGIDCDGDGSAAGTADILAGDPIVCPFDPDAGDTLADAFIGMLAGIKDYAPVDLAVRGPAKVVRPKGRTHFPKINVRAPSSYRLPVEFRCTKETAGTETPVRITAMRAGREIVATTATVECVAPRRPEPPPAPVVPPALVAAIIPPPPPPPAPVPQAQPNLNPNVNPNPNPQLNPNAGFAAQEEQEIQLAVAGNDVVFRTQEDLAMTGLDRSGPPLPALAWAAAFAMTGAAAYGMHLARRERAAPAYVRHR